MMQRKVFYSTVRVDGVVGIRKQDGYELQIDGKKFNAYQSIIDGMAYILDPQNGMAVQMYDTRKNEDGLSEIELIEKAKEKFIQSGALSRWKEKRNNKSYKLTIKMFKAYKKVELLREKQKETLRCEFEARRQQDNE